MKIETCILNMLDIVRLGNGSGYSHTYIQLSILGYGYFLKIDYVDFYFNEKFRHNFSFLKVIWNIGHYFENFILIKLIILLRISPSGVHISHRLNVAELYSAISTFLRFVKVLTSFNIYPCVLL